MADEWNIDELLAGTPTPMPDEKSKKQSINMAMDAFDKKNASSFQGIKDERRLTGKLHDWLRHNLIGDDVMKKGYVIAGGAFATVLVVGLMNTSSLTSVLPMGGDDKDIAKVHGQVHQLPAEDVQADTLVMDANKSEMAVAENEVAPASAPAASPSASRSLIMEKRAFGGASGSMVAQSIAPAPADSIAYPYYKDEGRDRFEDTKPNPVKSVKEEPVSTFSVDVDTASYSFVRASLNNNTLPQKDAVRVEEMINYFPYEYALPESKSQPFKANMSVFPSPWNKHTKLLHVGIKGFEAERKALPDANLVLLIDTSGSMYDPKKLPLLINSMKLLLDTLQDDDTISVVTYAGSAGVALEPTQVKDKAKIIAALDNLSAGGSTAGAEGIRQAYQLAEQHFKKGGVNRVMLATDGDFNVGITDMEELKGFVERKRDSGIFLSVLGFGMGNYNDALMQKLAQNGNGVAVYIDSLSEARKVLVEEATSSLFPIAKDVKIQVEFNPAQVAEYRLIGYETRMLNREDFNNDKVDAGDIGAGHTVTAIYELTPADSDAKLIDDLRYAKDEGKPAADAGDEYAFVKIRYKLPEENSSKLIETAITRKLEKAKLADVPAEARFATAVAGFAQLLRGDTTIGEFSYDDVVAMAQEAKGKDEFGYRAEFINLVRLAKSASALKPLGQ